jgi:hypothetical protein
MVNCSQKIIDLSLEITIVTDESKYIIVFTETEVKSFDFNLDVAKSKIPMMLEIKNRERIAIRNFVALCITKYKKYLYM